ncbi:MAG: DUF502 domain-containing protein [Candidatus Babeliaceae bacterium]
MKKNSLLHTFLNQLKIYFLSGLFTLLPLIVTIALFNFSFKVIKSWLTPITRYEPEYLKIIPHVEIILVILFILIFGFILKTFLLHSLIHLIESLFGRIPLVRQVYFGIKQLVHALSSQDKSSFQRVVLVEFPRENVYSIGFLTSEIASQIAPHTKEKFLSVFIPTTPNPTTGFYIMIAESACITTDLTRQEAMALIISGGIIQPERFTKK